LCVEFVALRIVCVR